MDRQSSTSGDGNYRNDASAKSRVERLVAIHSLELWEGERKIARFEAVR